jgi:hypothetical protein
MHVVSTAPRVELERLAAPHAAKGILDLPVHALYHTVSMRGVGYIQHMLDAQPRANRGSHSGVELGAPVGCDSVQHTKMCNPIGKEGFSAHAGLPLRSGMASTHLVKLSMTTNTKSTCTLENLCPGTDMAWSGAASCLWTFPPWHRWQSQHIAAMFLPTPFQT